MTNGNDSAYPQPMHRDVQNPIGLTKREYFAAMAMQGIISGYTDENKASGRFIPSCDYEELAEHFVQIADALIEQLKKTSL